MRQSVRLIAALLAKVFFLFGCGILGGLIAGFSTLWIDIPFGYASNGGMWVGAFAGAYVAYLRRVRSLNISN